MPPISRVQFFAVFGAVLVVVAACNIYSPFSSKSSTEDILEAAQKCLHDGDYDCAIAEYNTLPAGTLKDEQLCKVYLSKAGLGLDEIINTLTQQDILMLGTLANELVPWTSTRGEAATTALTHCGALATSCSNCKAGVLLRAISLLTDCGTRLAKTDQVIVAGAAGNNCTSSAATGNQNGRVTKTDIESGTNFMCVDDVKGCADDIAALDLSALGSSGYTKLQSAFTLIPLELRNGASASPYNAERAALQDVAPTN